MVLGQILLCIIEAELIRAEPINIPRQNFETLVVAAPLCLASRRGATPGMGLLWGGIGCPWLTPVAPPSIPSRLGRVFMEQRFQLLWMNDHRQE